MASPSFTGITPISYDGISDPWVTPATAVGDVASGGIDTSANLTTYGPALGLNGRATNTLMSAELPVSFDLTSTSIYGLVGVNSANGLNSEANGGLSVGLSDASDNYKLFTVGGSDTVAGFASWVISPGQTATLAGGVLNESSITKVIVGHRGISGSNASNPKTGFDQIGLVVDPTLSGGDLSEPASFIELVDLLSQTNLAAVEIIDGSNVHKIQVPITINCEYFRDDLVTVLFENSTALYIDDNYYYCRFGLESSTATFELSNANLISTIGLQVGVATASDTTNELIFNQCNIQAPGTTLVEAPMRWNGGSEINRTLVRYITGNVLNNRILVDSDLQIDCSPGDDLSAVSYRFAGTSKLILNPDSTGAAQIDLSGLTSSETVTVDNLTANNITISVGSGFVTNIESPTTGGGSITVVAPQISITLSGLVSGSRIYVRDTTNGVDLFNEIEATTSFSGAVGNAGNSLLIRVANASGTPKYKRYQTAIVIPGNNFEIPVNQELDV